MDFALDAGICLKKIIGCNQYEISGECRTCDTKFFKRNGICEPNGLIIEKCEDPFELINGKCQINFCKKFYDYGCYECEDGHHLLPNRKCSKKIIRGCAIYENTEWCQLCEEPIFEKIENDCLPFGCLEGEAGVCYSCREDFGFIKTDDGFCKIPHCLVYDKYRC